MTIAAGSRLGPYEVLSPLGAGGMGEVYRARDSRLGREVAIKVLPSELSADAERLKRFEKEAQSASSLNHPSIVTIYEIGQSDAVSWIAMELVDGKTLRELVAGGPLPIRKLLQIGAQVADGLARAHGAGIVHRDLKPENVMVTKDGLAKILDFGLAKLSYAGAGSGDETNLPTQTATAPGVVMGTVGYMSPEQASARAVDFRSDQFSFGSLLYEMASGKRAFQRSTAVQTLAAIIQDDPEPIGAVNPQVPTPLRWIVERCLAKDPEDRYASTSDLSRELATVRDRLSEASFSGAAPAAAPSRRSSRLRAAAVALALLIGVAAGIFAGRPIWKASFASQPTLRQITFRRATILDAWFAPDGQVVYAASAEDPTKGPGEIFSTRPGAFEPRSLGLPPANVVGVSKSGELAILVGGSFRQGTLATVPLAGGAPRELLEKVRRVSWAPDGKGLAVLHVAKGKGRIEFPIGKVLYETPGWIGKVQFSPKGDLIAFTDHLGFVAGPSGAGDLTIMDLSGKRRKIGRSGNELAWSPRGDEIWINNYYGKTSTIEAVSLSGRRRRIASFPGDFAFHDVSRDGRVLLEGITNQSEIVGRVSGEPAERNLSWLDGSTPADLSADGKTLLFTELGQGGGPNHAVYKRGTDGSPAVRLGEGIALALSPDGSWALSTIAGTTQLVLLPMGAGQDRTVPLPGMQIFGGDASFFPDGKRILLRAAEAGSVARLYVLDIESGKARPFTTEKVDLATSFAISPDGRTVVTSSEEGESTLHDVDGGPSRPVPGLPAGLYAIKWCADGRSLFVRTSGNKPLRVYRLELSSGRLELWKEFSVTDIRTGNFGVIPTPDGKSYVYGYTRDFSDLFIAEGLK